MKTLLIFFVVIHLQSLPRTGHCNETYDQVLSILPTTEEQVEILKNVSAEDETDLWRPVSAEFIVADAYVHLFVPAGKSQNIKDLLQTHHITYEVFVENTQRLIEMQTTNDSDVSRSSSSFYERYHNLEDIYHWINETQQENPTKVKVQIIGSSAEKRPLYVLKLSVNNSTNKKAMWIDCGIHAREWISPAFCMWFVDYSLSFYTKDQEITEILDNLDIYILPVMNPDGYKYTWTTDRMWRKNRSATKFPDCIGVDLNRNFDAKWCTKGASHFPCRETYCGVSPESEPESQAVANFLRSHKDSVQIYLTIHSYGQKLLFPYSYTYDKVPNHDDLGPDVSTWFTQEKLAYARIGAHVQMYHREKSVDSCAVSRQLQRWCGSLRRADSCVKRTLVRWRHSMVMFGDCHYLTTSPTSGSNKSLKQARSAVSIK